MPADPSDPRAWIQRACSNLRLAEKGHGKDILLEDLCFNAQQAAEKALKAICLYKGQDFPKTHSITRLVDLVESAGIIISEQIKEADFLTHMQLKHAIRDLLKRSLLKNTRPQLQLRHVLSFGLKPLFRSHEEESANKSDKEYCSKLTLLPFSIIDTSTYLSGRVVSNTALSG